MISYMTFGQWHGVVPKQLWDETRQGIEAGTQFHFRVTMMAGAYALFALRADDPRQQLTLGRGAPLESRRRMLGRLRFPRLRALTAIESVPSEARPSGKRPGATGQVR
jgi:hypothetical protein